MTSQVAWSRWALPALLVAVSVYAANAFAEETPTRVPAPVPVPIDSTHAAPTVPLRLPADIVFAHPGSPESAVVFSHASHVTPGEGACAGCHNGAFPMLRRGPVPRHRDMNAGGSCGGCHDGKQTFGVRDPASCATCHTGVQATPAAAATAPGKTGATAAGAGTTGAAALRLPKPHAYAQGDGSPGAVTFKHKTHAKDPADCATCHPTPWRKMAAPALANGAMHDKGACGNCHDGKKSFATDDDAKCARCHHETGARP